MTKLGNQLRIGDNLNLALVNNGIKVVLDLRVQNLTDMLSTETSLECSVADTDTRWEERRVGKECRL